MSAESNHRPFDDVISDGRGQQRRREKTGRKKAKEGQSVTGVANGDRIDTPIGQVEQNFENCEMAEIPAVADLTDEANISIDDQAGAGAVGEAERDGAKEHGIDEVAAVGDEGDAEGCQDRAARHRLAVVLPILYRWIAKNVAMATANTGSWEKNQKKPKYSTR